MNSYLSPSEPEYRYPLVPYQFTHNYGLFINSHESKVKFIEPSNATQSQHNHYIQCKIDFVNSQNCSELKSVVSEWYDSLTNNSEDHKLIRFILKHEVKIHNIVVFFFLSACTILINFIAPAVSNYKISVIPIDSNQRLFLFLTASIPLIYLFYRLGLLYADRIIKKIIGKLNRNPMFEFTKGDKNRFKEVKESNKKLLNKCKFSVSNDETRHYLSGIFFHQTQSEDKNFLTAAATDSHRMSISKIRLDQQIDFEPIILPKKTIFQLCSLLESYDGDVKISNIKSKIKFELNNSILISKLIDGKFPNYIQVIPKNNQKKLEIDLKLFLDSVDRVASVSLDKKDGVKFNLSKDVLNLSVNNTNSGDGKESLSVKFDHDLEISFNSRYLIDVASQLDGDKIEIFFNDTGSPALIKDPGDFDSIFVVMPMKG